MAAGYRYRRYAVSGRGQLAPCNRLFVIESVQRVRLLRRLFGILPVETLHESAELASLGFADLFPPSAAAAKLPPGQVVVIGNCYAESIQRGLASASATGSRFSIFVVPLHLKSVNDPEVREVLARANYVVAQRVGGLDHVALKLLLPPRAKVWTFPDVIFRSAWPFDSAHGQKDTAAESNPQTAIRNFDGALAALRTIEPDKKKRLERYSNLDFDMAASIPRIVEAQERFLASVDEASDVGLGKFILDHTKERQLFYNSTHPSGAVFQYLCEEFWLKLGLPPDPPKFSDLESWRDWSVPVHPLIANRLGLRWADEKTRYRYCTLGDLTWREWVETYVETFG